MTILAVYFTENGNSYLGRHNLNCPRWMFCLSGHTLSVEKCDFLISNISSIKASLVLNIWQRQWVPCLSKFYPKDTITEILLRLLRCV